MRLADFALEVRAVRGAGACVDVVGCYVLRRDLRWYGNLGDDVLDLRGRSAAAATRPCARAHMRDEGLLDERGDYGALPDTLCSIVGTWATPRYTGNTYHRPQVESAHPCALLASRTLGGY